MSLYEDYKRNTQVWLAWLMQTAKDHDSKVQTAGTVDPVAARKGKDRKRPNKANQGSSRQYVTTREILKQGEFLRGLNATSKTTFIMPRNVARSYRAALAMRELYAAWFTNDPNANPEDNERHRYFNNVIKKVHDLLKGCILVQKSSGVASQAAQSSSDTDSILNAFEQLQLDDENGEHPESTTEEELTPLARQLPKRPAKKTSKKSAQTSNKLHRMIYVPKLTKIEDVRIKWVSLLEDARSIKVFLENLWPREDTSADIDLFGPEVYTVEDHAGIASFIIEAGIALFGHREQEFHRQADEVLSGEDPSSKYLPIATGDELSTLSVTLSDVARERRGDNLMDMVRLKPLDVRHPTMTEAGSVSIDRLMIQWLYDLQIETELRQSEWEDENVVREKYGCKLPLLPNSLDHLSQVLQSISDGQKVNLQSVLAAQMIVLLAVQEPHFHRVKKLFSESHDNLPLDIWGNSTALQIIPSYQELLTVWEWFINWPIEDYRKDLKSSEQGEFITNADDYSFFRRKNPIAIGKLYLSYLVLREEASLALVNTGPHLFSMCHLYNALLQTRRISLGAGAAGNLFEIIITLHMEDIFMGSKFPADSEEMLNNIRIAGGTSPSFVQAGKELKDKQRDFKPWEKYTKEPNRWHLKTLPAHELLRDYLHGRKTLIEIVAQFYQMLQKDLPKREQRAFHDMDIVETLSKLYHRLHLSIPRFEMDYVTAHADCTELLRRIFAGCGGVIPLLPMRQVRPEHWDNGTDSAYALVNSLIRDIGDVEALEKAKKKGHWGRVAAASKEPEKRLAIASKIMQEYLDTYCVAPPA